MKQKRKLLRVGIAIVAAAACVVALVVYLAAWQKGQTQTVATVTWQGKVIRTVDLSKVTQTETFTVGEAGNSNTIQISPKGIGVICADCPDQICVHQGIRSHGPEPIVCLPHQLSIRFSAPDPNGVDAVTGR